MHTREHNATVLLTRPAGKNEYLAAKLHDAGIGSLVLPALAVEALPANCDTLPRPDAYDLVVFVSGHAVRYYIESLERCRYASNWPVTTQVATVGVASAKALEENGLFDITTVLCPPSNQLQDSESLWGILQPHIGRFTRVLIVRGQDGREWLGQQLEKAQVHVTRYAAYHRHAMAWTPPQVALLNQYLTTPHPMIVVLTSAASMDAFFANVRKHPMQRRFMEAHYVVIHARIATSLRAMLETFSGKVDAASISISSPSDDAIFNTIQSLAFV